MSRTPPSTRDQQVWTFRMPVRWGDQDMLGHVNNAQLFVYSESARLAFFEHVFGKKEGLFRDGSGPILAEIGCVYHRQLRYPAELEIEVRVVRIGSRSLELQTPVFLKGEDTAVADLRTTLVWFDYAAQKAVAVPELLQPYLYSEA